MEDRRAGRQTARRIGLAIALLLLGGQIASAQERCVAARDMMTAARARLQPGASAGVLRDALEALRRATELCPGLGDAYFFLSLIARELKDDVRAENWRLKAEFYGSPAMKSGEALLASAAGFPTTVPAPGKPAAIVPSITSASPLTAEASAASARVSPYVRQKLALVVGISKFKDPKINALRYTTADAAAVAAFLREQSGFTYVKTLLDQEATTYNIKTGINQIAKMAGPEDLVVIYFASHGSPENLDTAGVNYIVTHDTEVNNLYPTAYRMDELTDDIGGRIRAERVVAFLDACYSGGTFKELPPGWVASSRTLSQEQGLAVATLQGKLKSGGRSVLVETAASDRSGKVAQGVGRAIITASEQTERSWEHDRIKHGYFTYFLLESLKRPGLVSVEDMFADLRIKVPEAVLREHGESQHPTIARSRDRVDLYLRDDAAASAKPGNLSPIKPRSRE